MIDLASRRIDLSRARSGRWNTRRAVRVELHPRAAGLTRARAGRIAMPSQRATPPSRPRRLAAVGPTLILAALLASQPASGDPLTTPGPDAHVPSDMSTKPAAPIVLEPLSPRQRAAFLAPGADEPAAELGGVTEARKGQHYVTGNERALEAFYPRIQGLGGAYVGVGSDQAYLLLGWARAELAWLIDYDPEVVDLHAVYHALFAAAATPALFIELWHKDHKARAIAALHAAHPGAAGLHHEAVFRRHRARVAKRLGQLQLAMTAAGVPTFLTDADEYTHVRALIRAGRVRALLADLGRDGAVQQIGAAARSLATPVRVVYLSNAEEYWEVLPQAFRDNLAALHVDERSVVLRTLLTWETNQDYRYNAQPARNYKQWLADPRIQSIYDVVHRRPAFTPGVDFFETTELPDEQRVRRRHERRLRAAARRAELEQLAQPPAPTP